MQIAWTEATLARRTPRRAHGGPPPEAVPAEALSAAVRRVLAKCSPSGKEDGSAVAAFPAAIEGLRAIADGAPFPWDQEREAVQLALAASVDTDAFDALVQSCVDRAGAPATLATHVAALRWRLTEDGRLINVDEVKYGYGIKLSWDTLVRRHSVRLRRHLFAHPELEAPYEKVAAGLEPCEACVLAWHLPEAAWGDAAALRMLKWNHSYSDGHRPSAYSQFYLVAACSLSADVAAQIGRRASTSNTTPMYDFFDRFGEAAWPVVGPLIASIGAWNSKSASIDALAIVSGPEDLSPLVPHLGLPERYPLMERFFRDDPPRGLTALLAAADGSGAVRAAVHKLLDKLLDAHPALVEQIGLPTESRHALDAVLAFRKLGFADEAEIPAILRSPPWRGRKKQAKITPITLTPLPTETVYPHVEPQPISRYDRRYTPEAEGELLKDPTRISPWQFRLLSPEGQKTLAEPKLMDRFTSNWQRNDLVSIVREWIGRWGADVLPLAERLFSELTQGELGFIKGFGHAAFVPTVVGIFNRRRRERRAALAWMTEFPRITASVLIPRVLAKAQDRDGERALRALWQAAEADVRAVAGDYGVEAQVAERAGRDPLELLPASMPSLEITWGQLPPIRLKSGRFLPEAAWTNALLMVRISTVDDPYAGLEVLKEHCTEESLAELAECWLDLSRDNWSWAAVAHLGDEGTAQKLGMRLRKRYLSEGDVDLLLRALLVMGSDAALLEIARIAERAQKPKHKLAARTLLQELAQDRGLTDEELADRMVPDLDLEEDGTAILDFGPREFRVRLTELLQPYVVDAGGKRLPKFPSAAKTDDKEKVKAATSRWKELCTSLENLAKSQLPRLERAMVDGRTWSAGDFRRYLVEHPLMRHLARRLVWEETTTSTCFRVAEDLSFADASDDPYTLPADGVVRLVHPIDMPAATLAAWGQVFADYELVQPFPQLGRPIFTLGAGEGTGTDTDRFEGQSVPAKVLLGLLGAAGWEKGSLEFGTSLSSWHKTFEGTVATISVRPDIEMGNLDSLHTVRLHGGKPLGELSPRAFSELVRPLESVRR